MNPTKPCPLLQGKGHKRAERSHPFPPSSHPFPGRLRRTLLGSSSAHSFFLSRSRTCDPCCGCRGNSSRLGVSSLAAHHLMLPSMAYGFCHTRDERCQRHHHAYLLVARVTEACVHARHVVQPGPGARGPGAAALGCAWPVPHVHLLSDAAALMDPQRKHSRVRRARELHTGR